MEQNTWEKRENLENAKKALKKFKGQMNAEVRRQERIEMVEEREFRRRELLGRYTAKLLYEWDDRRFEKVGKKLAKVEVSFSRGETLKRG